MATEQQHHHLKIQSSLGKDALALESIRVSDGMSRLFEITVRFVANKRISDMQGQVGEEVTISLTLSGQAKAKERYFHGHIRTICELGKPLHNKDGQRYEAVIVPRAWSAQNRTNCRIFQDETAADIVETVLSEHDVDLTKKIDGELHTYKYCVQYNETDWAFVCRLLAQEGLFFYFEHSKSGHKMVISDNVNAYQPAEENKVVFRSGSTGDCRIASWYTGHRATPNAMVEQGFDFTKPKESIEDPTEEKVPGKAFGGRELFRYIGEDAPLNENTKLAKTHLQGLAQDASLFQGTTNYPSFGVGLTFEFREHEDAIPSHNEFVITEMELTASAPINSDGGSRGAAVSFNTTFECIPTDKVYVPTRIKKPSIPGVQTATVTVGSGEELHVDEHGRVKVQFHWDREGKNNHKSSCWIRVAQSWAGDGFGAQFLPREGQEVMVEFVNGDPDQPLITGTVYNGDNRMPYSPKDQFNSSGIRSRSTTKGGKDNYSEIRFDDDKGEELLVLHAEKDHELTVENDETDDVGNNRKTKVGNDDNLAVKNNQTVDITGDQKTDIGGSQTIKAGKSVTVDAGTSITLQTGAATITLESSGAISIEGTQISLNGTTIALKGASISLN
ncbi:type VI secretion system secreted protein VgrG [Halospina denitrificans]|uniref:Type VI secretion system secreted protein VgrG n=1 Tax=Halospina denitrificans TaxID=332522 RepID=A0A4R7K0I6_9GAMM|nr:type VI secretion system tip protein TssI/VgrG [Halospina denitrificans]TDT43946.1 type VI secretion system secreted protein VgrG [Halospina denitrificans]